MVEPLRKETSVMDSQFAFYQFRVNPKIDFDEAEMTLQLALTALEGLYGEARLRLEARYSSKQPARTLTVDVRTAAGDALAQIFVNLMIKEFGPDSFSVGRLASDHTTVSSSASLVGSACADSTASQE